MTPPLRVRFISPAGAPNDLVFTRPFRIGRVEDCDICIKNEYVSRSHVEVSFDDGAWHARDLGSSNGIFVDGKRVESVRIARSSVIRLGVAGPDVAFEVQTPPAREDAVAHLMDHYFNPQSGEPAGEHTILVRQAFSRVQKKQKSRYVVIIAVLGALGFGAAGYAFYLHQQAARQKLLAENLFYQMKSLDVDIANVERLQGGATIQRYQERREAMQKNYEQFLSALHVVDSKMTPKQRIVFRVARIFGECELDMPKDFEAEINDYIDKWKSSGRLVRAIHRAKENGYAAVIAHAFLAQDLPPQFFYLGLQESDFDPLISGPPTPKGIAKGMWQFIPSTAATYGLKVGPLAELRRPDPGDDRHHWEKETLAAATYIKFLYSTDAQASGMLVMACYNWGERSVLPLVQKMPSNPKERNFWRLLALYKDKVPRETYDYVFYIVSAAVIGENPHLFGFDFDDPLANVQ